MIPAALRPLAASTAIVGGRPLVALVDPLGLATGDGAWVLRLETDEFAVARLFGRGRSVAELVHLAAEQGVACDAARVEALALRLGAAGLLDDEPTRAALQRAWEAFDALPARAPLGAGRDYPADPFELRLAIGGMVADDWDLPPPDACVAAWTSAANLKLARALHARTWAALRHFTLDFDRVLVLAPLAAPLATSVNVLTKSLATPLGTVALDRELAMLFPTPQAPEGLAAARALALERQALFLRVLYRDKPALFALVRRTEDASETSDLEARLAAALRLPRTLVLVAADLAHAELDLPLPDAPTRSERSPTALRDTRDTHWIVRHELVDAARDDDAGAVDAATRVDPLGLDELAAREPDAARAATLALLARFTAALALARPDVRGSLLGYAQANARGALLSGASVLFH
ncbi:MAG: AmmeMemoRadiSam system protein B [Planctomycetes bacterium]|nr:AmmeMemoRadiSam system protein B [Planctomycetota bacterium]